MTDTPVETSEVVRTFTAAWRHMSSQYPGNLQAQDGTVCVSLSNTICPFFNMLTIDRPIKDTAGLRSAITTARRYAEDCPHDAMLLMCPEWLPDNAEDIAKDEALEFSMRMWGMATDTLAPTRRDPANLDMRVALEESTCSDIGNINADAYEMPSELFSVTGNLYRWSGENFGIVGYDQIKAVSSTLTYLLDDEIYVAMVATIRGLHGGGYAETVMRRAIAEAQKKCGDGRIWLHATEAGRPLYTSMGFTLGAELRLYSFA